MKFFLTSILLGISLLPASALAQNFLVGIPGIGSPTGNFDGYINAIYAMFISIAALLAVVKIVIAGVKYMFSDIVTQKSEAKKDIQGAIFGLILILGAVLILTVINPDLTNFNLEQNQIPRPAPIVGSSGSTNPFVQTNIQPGDTILNFDGAGIVTGASPSEELLRNLCENIVEEACPTTWFGRSFSGKPLAACYEGEFFPNIDNSCVIRGNNLRLSEYDCDSTGQVLGDGGRVETYDCTDARAACLLVSGIGELDSNRRQINCNYDHLSSPTIIENRNPVEANSFQQDPFCADFGTCN